MSMQSNTKTLHSIFEKALENGMIMSNPAKKIKKLKLPHQEMRFLDQNEIQLLLEVTKREYPNFYPLLYLAIFTGMRRGEILGLTWDKINWVTNKITVNQSLYKGKLIEPKTKTSIRKVDMTKSLALILKEHKRNRKVASKIVFPNSVGKFFDGKNMVNNRFSPCIRKAKIDKIRFHDLRHTYASLLILKNVPIKYIQAQMGHSSIQVTMDRYGHLLPDVHTQAINALEDICQKYANSKSL